MTVRQTNLTVICFDIPLGHTQYKRVRKPVKKYTPTEHQTAKRSKVQSKRKEVVSEGATAAADEDTCPFDLDPQGQRVLGPAFEEFCHWMTLGRVPNWLHP